MNSPVVSLGLCSVEYLGLVSRYTEPGNRSELRQFSLQGGGTAATAAATVATLGGAARFVGKVSDDDFGRAITRGLDAHGVDTQHVVVAPGHVSPFAFVVVDDEAPPPKVYFTRGNVPVLEPQEVPEAALHGAGLLLVDGGCPPAQIAAAEQARSAGVPVLFVGDVSREGTGDLIGLADALICGERFATDVAPRGELEDSLKELCAMGPDTAVITLDDAGSIGRRGEELVRRDAYRVAVLESTRARDVYAGAFAYAMRAAWSLERCVHFASVAAALSCRALGRRAALPELAEVLLACGWRP